MSGWHFSLFASALFFLFGSLPTKIKYFLALSILSGLTLLFPWSPSVWRAWISLALICLSPFSSGYCSSLNRLGIGCILCSLVFSPLSPAFSLSFLATLGILLFFPHLFRFFFIPWKEIAPGYLLPLIRYFFSALSIAFASQIFLFFPAVNFFQSFPLEGLIYNLFFPLIILPLFSLILLSLILPFAAPMTKFCISWIISHPLLHSPNVLTSLELTPLSPEKLTLIFIFLFFLGERREKTTENPSLTHAI
nr:ComEC/Rec2 family competence protein [Chlamydia caviae]